MSDSPRQRDAARLLARRVVVPIGAGLLACAAIWAVFEFVVTDPDLFLSYVEALRWPGIAAVILFLLRKPLVEKVRQVLRVEGFGVSAEFAEREARLLDDQLRRPIASVLGSAGASARDIEAIHTEDEAAGQPDDREPVDDDGDYASEDREELTDEEPAPRDGEWLELERQESIEEIVRRSADWGYDLASGGTPRMVPEIEWDDEGEWHITTEIPESPGESPAEDTPTGLDRAIQRLEDEILKLERQKRSPYASLSLRSMGDDEWLLELKRRLARIDPTNPFSWP